MKKGVLLPVCLCSVTAVCGVALSVETKLSSSAEPVAGRNGPAEPTSSTRHAMRKLWRSGIQALPLGKATVDLRQKIQQMERIKARVRQRKRPQKLIVSPPVGDPPTTAPASTRQATRPAPTSRATSQPSITKPPRARFVPVPATRPAEALALGRLKKVPPEAVVDAVSLADAVFLSGHLEEAAVFYELAWKQATEDETKAWVVFQLANCRKDSDPTAGHTFYGRVISEYPNSPWSGPAQALDRLLAWRQTHKPQVLLESQPSQSAEQP